MDTGIFGKLFVLLSHKVERLFLVSINLLCKSVKEVKGVNSIPFACDGILLNSALVNWAWLSFMSSAKRFCFFWLPTGVRWHYLSKRKASNGSCSIIFRSGRIDFLTLSPRGVNWFLFLYYSHYLLLCWIPWDLSVFFDIILELGFGISLKFLFPFLFPITPITNTVYFFPRILSTFIDGSIQINDVPSSISRT